MNNKLLVELIKLMESQVKIVYEQGPHKMEQMILKITVNSIKLFSPKQVIILNKQNVVPDQMRNK
jgi:hypothetical protein